MYEGYLNLGGNEVGNSARAFGYTRTSECPIHWLECDCEHLSDALGDVPYAFESIDQAPWYDSDVAELSSKFLGASIVSVSGFDDSTAQAQMVQKTTAGGQFSGHRHASRTVRARAFLTAVGADGLDYGLAWLRAALEPGTCGVHSSTCGTTSLEFLAACPPERGLKTVYGEWAEARRNRALVPRAIIGTSSAAWTMDWGTGGAGSNALENGLYKSTWSAAPSGGNVRIALARAAAHRIPVTPGETLTVSFDAASDIAAGASLVLDYRNSGGTYVSQSGGSPVVLSSNTASPTRMSRTVTIPTGTGIAYMDILLTVTSASATVGKWLAAGRLLVEASATLGEYFDGGSTPVTPEIQSYSWASAENASESIYEVRDSSQESYTDEEYEELQVGPLRRFLHGVARTSGPLVQQYYESSDKIHWGALVEFTLEAEEAFIYSKTREIELTPTTPTIFQDVPYNLVPYPSAELAGASVNAGVNHSTNPSLETNATGWSSASSAVSGTAPAAYVAAARSNDIAAVGTWSYRVRLTGSGGAAGTANLDALQTVDVSARYAGARLSFHIWGALLATGSGGSRTSLTAQLEWLDGASAVIGSAITIDTTSTEFDGYVFQARSLLPPGGAVSARIRLRGVVVWTATSVFSVYADALAVTEP